MKIETRFRSMGSLLAALLMLAGCASIDADISSDRNPELDASRLQTWAWVDPLGTDRAGYEAIVTTRLKGAVQAELEARGMRYSEDSPQALVNFYVNLEEEQEVQIISGVRPGARYDRRSYYGYRVGLYDPWIDQQLTTRSYTLGTLTIDVVDAEANQVAWTAKAQGRVTRAAIEDPASAVQDVVTAMFTRYP